MTSWLRKFRNNYKHNKQLRNCAELKQQLSEALKNCPNKIPVLVVSYNNGRYVRNTVEQLAKYAIQPIIIDNCSNKSETTTELKKIQHSELAQVVYSKSNHGHMVGFIDPVYMELPEVFAYTDPDLSFNPAMPKDFLDILSHLTQEYGVYKAGLALALLENTPIISNQVRRIKNKPMIYDRSFTVAEWEAQFWRKPLRHKTLEVYAAPIDTTFAVYRKSNYLGTFLDAIRVAGSFSAIHLPWYPQIDIFTEQDKDLYRQGNRSSTWI